MYGQADVVRLLLQAAAMQGEGAAAKLANAADDDGVTALMRAAYSSGAHGHKSRCVEAVLAAGADVKQRDCRGGDALRWGCWDAAALKAERARLRAPAAAQKDARDQAASLEGAGAPDGAARGTAAACTAGPVLVAQAVRNTQLLQGAGTPAEGGLGRRGGRQGQSKGASDDRCTDAGAGGRPHNRAGGPARKRRRTQRCDARAGTGGMGATAGAGCAGLAAAAASTGDCGMAGTADPVPLTVPVLYRALTAGTVDDGRVRVLRCVVQAREGGRNRRGVPVLHATHVHGAVDDAVGTSPAKADPSFSLGRLICSRGDETVLHALAGDAAADARGNGSHELDDEDGAAHGKEADGSKRSRHVHFARWLLRRFGAARLRAGTGVLDVAGGKGSLFAELCGVLNADGGGGRGRDIGGDGEAGDRGAGGNRGSSASDYLYTLVEPAHANPPAALASAVTARGSAGAWAGAGTVCTPHALSVATGGRVQHLPMRFEARLWRAPPPGRSGADAEAEAAVRSRLLSCGVIVGMHADEATEAIIDFALAHGKPFAVVPCCVFPSLFPRRRLRSGQRVAKYGAFLAYLAAKHHGIRIGQLPFAGKNKVLYLC
eukprot:g5788.t1